MQSVRSVWRWWSGEIGKFVPAWVLVAFFGGSSAKPLTFSGGASEIQLTRGKIVAPVSLLTADRPVVARLKRECLVDVELPQELVLSRKIRAPRKATKNIYALATLDLKRNTPFDESSVVWALGKTETMGDGVVAVQYVAKNSDIAALRRRLAEVGLKSRSFVVGDSDGRLLVLSDHRADVAPTAKVWRRLNAALVVASFAAGLFLWLEPAWTARQNTLALEPDLASLRSETLALRRDVEALKEQEAQEDQLRASLRARIKLVETIRETTVALPDEAWVSNLAFGPRALTLSGETSGAAVELVLGLAKNRHFGDPRLSGPTTRTGSGKEKFEIASTPGGSQ